jgi:hypothetical protein
MLVLVFFIKIFLIDTPFHAFSRLPPYFTSAAGAKGLDEG